MPMTDSTFAELTKQAQRLVREAEELRQPLPVFALTPGEVRAILDANYCMPADPKAPQTFHGMKIRVVQPW